jgi:hypothetical protein
LKKENALNGNFDIKMGENRRRLRERRIVSRFSVTIDGVLTGEWIY